MEKEEDEEAEEEEEEDEGKVLGSIFYLPDSFHSQVQVNAETCRDLHISHEALKSDLYSQAVQCSCIFQVTSGLKM